MNQPHKRISLTPLERLLSAFTKIHAGEGISVSYFFANAFLLLFVYYLLKPVRDALVLTEGGAELRSYALAIQAILLMAAIPLYSYLFHGMQRLTLLRSIILFFSANLVVFFALGMAHINVGVAFFIWLGIISVTLVAEFWAFSADVFNVAAGHRLFALIAAGSSLGSLLGSQVSKMLFSHIGAYGLMLVAAVCLALTALLCGHAERTVPERSRCQPEDASHTAKRASLLEGFSIVLNDRYLLLVGVFVLLLNCINSTGEFILAKIIVAQAEAAISANPALIKSEIIGTTYGNYYFWVNLLTVLAQFLLVRRMWQLVGIPGALLTAPIIAIAGYGLISFMPTFTLVYLYKILENSTDYSIQSTTRHALFLPVSHSKKFQGKTCIDTLIWRLGDLIQALVVYVGLNVFGFGITHFAVVNFVLSIAWLLAVIAIGVLYKRTTKLPAKLVE
ncbi:MAG: hypothetical protein HY849_07440 [Nitrosomonadales bacterium]|nr:hypothetical protein [Nitrosomonadales bacterium]